MQALGREEYVDQNRRFYSALLGLPIFPQPPFPHARAPPGRGTPSKVKMCALKN
jgi:hypothetical protein